MPNWVENLLVIDGVSRARLEEILNIIVGIEIRVDESTGKPFYLRRAIDFRKIVPVPNNLEEHGENELDWCSENWGTKWNSLNNKAITPNTIFFLTAWNPPLGIMVDLSYKFPEATFVLNHSSESGLSGIYTIRNQIINHEFSIDYPDKFDKLRIKLRKLKHKFEDDNESGTNKNKFA